MPRITKLAFRSFKKGSLEIHTNGTVFKDSFLQDYTNICFSTL